MPARKPPPPIPAPPPDETDGLGRSWAHVSGWALLSGTRHTVSCIVTCQDQARELLGLLPTLSDTLTECGYPWELIVVDCESIDQTHEVIARWRDIPGFRYLRSDGGTKRTLAVAAGLCEARGDAVIVVEAGGAHVADHLPSMILRWEAGARLVCATRDPDTGESRLSDWDETSVRQMTNLGGDGLPAETTAFSLLDRALVNRLVAA